MDSSTAARGAGQSIHADWARVLEELRRRTRPQQFETWFAPLRVREMTESDLELVVPNRFYRDWLQNNYIHLIRETLLETLGTTPVIRLREETVEGPSPAARQPTSDPRPPHEERVPLVAGYTFENFVVGASNRLAHAAALAVVESPGKAYNPMFLHGSVGLGKTHLLQAICHALLQRSPDTSLRYLSCESFMNEFISSIQHGSSESFRERYRRSDVIVIDDVHILARGESTQEEFFHTFNALYNAHKQIILSSDRSPEEIRSIEERLISRFKWGLVCRIDPPEFEMRVAIVQKKAQAVGKQLPEGVASLIAGNVDNNIRELEGAINRVLGYSRLSNRPVDLGLAQEALKDLAPPRRPVGIEQIMQQVAHVYNVKVADLQSRRKSKSIAFPRQICMHLARRLTSHSLEEIGGYFGGRDHTTVLYADEKIQSMLQADPDFSASLSRLASEIQKS